MKKLLAVLVNYGESQLEYLQQVVTEICMFKNFEAFIVVNSNIPLDRIIEGIDLVNVLYMEDYQLLPMTCRGTIWRMRDDFDVFYYGENDHLLLEGHVQNHLDYTEILPPDRISGLMQYERDCHEVYYPAYHAEYDWDYDSVETHDDVKFAHFTNLHQASFILTQAQLYNIGDMHDFTKPIGQCHYSAKCKTNTDIYRSCGMKKVICISGFRWNLIHHLPNTYINGSGDYLVKSSPEERMGAALGRLLS